MNRASVLTLIASFACVTVGGAQAPAQPRKPGPEVQKLGYFIGNWRAEGEMKASMFGPAGTFTNTTRSEWTLGGLFYINQHEEQNPTGRYVLLGVTGYDARKKVYFSYSFDPSGGVGRAEGTLMSDAGPAPAVGHPTGHEEGTLVADTWTWTSDYQVDGATVKTRSVIKPRSATSYDFTWEIAPHGTDWTIVQQGRATKTP